MAAMIALIFMTTRGCSSAEFDGAHDSKLIAGQLMGCSIGRAVLAEDLRNLKATGRSHLRCGLRNRLGGSVEGTEDLSQVQPTDMQIDRGRGGRSVAQKHLDMMEARSRFNQVGGEAMP